jgi:hypothetical protein
MRLGFSLLHVTSDNELMKKMSWFCAIKFHLNENIEWSCIMQLQLNETQFNSIQFNSNQFELDLVQQNYENWIMKRYILICFFISM